jgi:hypothetical protein
MIATVTAGWIIGLVALTVLLLVCLAWLGYGILSGLNDGWGFAPIAHVIGAGLTALVIIGCWWIFSAFTTSGDYHAWNEKSGTVEQISKRIVPAGDKGIQERFVFRFADKGGLYGVDDTRASLVRRGDRVSLKCKKDYQWGVPREAHGWACRWNTLPESIQGGM